MKYVWEESDIKEGLKFEFPSNDDIVKVGKIVIIQRVAFNNNWTVKEFTFQYGVCHEKTDFIMFPNSGTKKDCVDYFNEMQIAPSFIK